MDTELQTVVTALDETRGKLRESATGPARARAGRRDDVPASDEHRLLGAIAALVEAVQEFAAVLPDRMTTTNSRVELNRSALELRPVADRLRRAEEKAATDRP